MRTYETHETLFSAVLLQLGVFKYIAVVVTSDGFKVRSTEVRNISQLSKNKVQPENSIVSCEACTKYALKMYRTACTKGGYLPVFMTATPRIERELKDDFKQYTPAHVMLVDAWVTNTDKLNVSDSVIKQCWNNCPTWFKDTVTNVRLASGEMVAFNAGEVPVTIGAQQVRKTPKLKLFKTVNNHLFGTSYKG